MEKIEARKYEVPPGESLFFDTNIWLIINGPMADSKKALQNVYGGILSVITHRGTLSDVRISNDLQMLAYEFPQNRPSFDMPLYDEVNKMSRKPDFRHTM